MIDKPTRVHRGCATLIDNIIANQICDSVLSSNVVLDISDHFFPFCLLPSLNLRLSGKRFQRKYRDFSFFSDDAFLHDLIQIDWDNPINENDVEKSFSFFFNKTNKILNKHAPLKTTT